MNRDDKATDNAPELEAEEKSRVRARGAVPRDDEINPGLARTLRFARLVRASMPDHHPDARLLQLAITRRDVTLLETLLRELHQRSNSTPKAG